MHDERALFRTFVDCDPYLSYINLFLGSVFFLSNQKEKKHVCVIVFFFVPVLCIVKKNYNKCPWRICIYKCDSYLRKFFFKKNKNIQPICIPLTSSVCCVI